MDSHEALRDAVVLLKAWAAERAVTAGEGGVRGWVLEEVCVGRVSKGE